jgi:hypothetical protein
LFSFGTRAGAIPKLAKQIETSRLPNRVMRRPRADREETQLTAGSAAGEER